MLSASLAALQRRLAPTMTFLQTGLSTDAHTDAIGAWLLKRWRGGQYMVGGIRSKITGRGADGQEVTDHEQQTPVYFILKMDFPETTFKIERCDSSRAYTVCRITGIDDADNIGPVADTPRAVADVLELQAEIARSFNAPLFGKGWHKKERGASTFRVQCFHPDGNYRVAFIDTGFKEFIFDCCIGPSLDGNQYLYMQDGFQSLADYDALPIGARIDCDGYIRIVFKMMIRPMWAMGDVFEYAETVRDNVIDELYAFRNNPIALWLASLQHNDYNDANAPQDPDLYNFFDHVHVTKYRNSYFKIDVVSSETGDTLRGDVRIIRDSPEVTVTFTEYDRRGNLHPDDITYVLKRLSSSDLGEMQRFIMLGAFTAITDDIARMSAAASGNWTPGQVDELGSPVHVARRSGSVEYYSE